MALTIDSRAHRATKLLGGAGQGKAGTERTSLFGLPKNTSRDQAESLKVWADGVREGTGWGLNYIRRVFWGDREGKKIVKGKEVFK